MVTRDAQTMIGMKVDEEGAGVVRAIVETELEHTSQINEDAFSYTSVVYDPSAGDTIIFIRNDHKTLPLHGVSVKINNGATASSFDIHVGTASITAAGTTITPLNLNTKGPLNPDITAIADETANSQGTLFETIFMGADSREVVDCLGLNLAQGHWIGVDMTEDGAANEVSVTVICHFGIID